MSSFYGNASIGSGDGLPVVNNNDNGKSLIVKNGAWAVDNSEGLQNLVDGSAEGSVRGIYTEIENENYTIGPWAVAEGYLTRAPGQSSHAEGRMTVAAGNKSHAEGESTSASGSCSHSEGWKTSATGNDSHAEGNTTSATGNVAHAEGFHTTASGGYAHVEGYYSQVTGNSAHAEGNSTLANNTGSHAEGLRTVASGMYSHAEGTVEGTFSLFGVSYTPASASRGSHTEGYNTYANSGSSDFAPHAEGSNTAATGQAAHAEGHYTLASGKQAHSEGNQTKATGLCSHAEGQFTEATGDRAHAEGAGTIASGANSHASGNKTIANHSEQFVFGEFNIADTSSAAATERGTYVEIVGNGDAENYRSNARTLDWNGNEVLAGKLTIGTGPINNMDVTTKQYVDNKIQPFIVHVSEGTQEIDGEQRHYYILDQTAEAIITAYQQTQVILEYELPSDNIVAPGYTMQYLCSQLLFKYNESNELINFILPTQLVDNNTIFTATSNIDFPIFYQGTKK